MFRAVFKKMNDPETRDNKGTCAWARCSETVDREQNKVEMG